MLRTVSFLCALLAGNAAALAQDTGDPLDVPGEGTDTGSAGAEASAGGEVSAGGEATAGGEASGGASAEVGANTGAAEEGGGAGGGFGVGIVAMITPGGPSGAEFVYDPGRFHIEGILGFNSIEDGASDIALGGRFWWHLATSTAADFSLGGGIGFVLVDNPDGAEDETDIHVEGGAQVRTFVVPNVALAASLGLAIVSGDSADFVGITGQLMGAIGVSYFF
jgi:hypothetical protein